VATQLLGNGGRFTPVEVRQGDDQGPFRAVRDERPSKSGALPNATLKLTFTGDKRATARSRRVVSVADPSGVAQPFFSSVKPTPTGRRG